MSSRVTVVRNNGSSSPVTARPTITVPSLPEKRPMGAHYVGTPMRRPASPIGPNGAGSRPQKPTGSSPTVATTRRGFTTVTEGLARSNTPKATTSILPTQRAPTPTAPAESTNTKRSVPVRTFSPIGAIAQQASKSPVVSVRRPPESGTMANKLTIARPSSPVTSADLKAKATAGSAGRPVIATRTLSPKAVASPLTPVLGPPPGTKGPSPLQSAAARANSPFMRHLAKSGVVGSAKAFTTTGTGNAPPTTGRTSGRPTSTLSPSSARPSSPGISQPPTGRASPSVIGTARTATSTPTSGAARRNVSPPVRPSAGGRSSQNIINGQTNRTTSPILRGAKSTPTPTVGKSAPSRPISPSTTAARRVASPTATSASSRGSPSSPASIRKVTSPPLPRVAMLASSENNKSPFSKRATSPNAGLSSLPYSRTPTVVFSRSVTGAGGGDSEQKKPVTILKRTVTPVAAAGAPSPSARKVPVVSVKSLRPLHADPVTRSPSGSREGDTFLTGPYDTTSHTPTHGGLRGISNISHTNVSGISFAQDVSRHTAVGATDEAEGTPPVPSKAAIQSSNRTREQVTFVQHTVPQSGPPLPARGKSPMEAATVSPRRAQSWLDEFEQHLRAEKLPYKRWLALPSVDKEALFDRWQMSQLQRRIILDV